MRRGTVELVGARQQAPRDLGLGGGGFLVVDQPARPLRLDLLELLAIDGKRAGGGGGLGCRAGRASGRSTATRTAAVMTAKAIHRSMRCSSRPSGGVRPLAPTLRLESKRQGEGSDPASLTAIGPAASGGNRRQPYRAVCGTGASVHYAFG